METPIFQILNKAVANQKKGIEFVMATVVKGAEKTPGRSGFRLIFYGNGKSEGTVGGGTLEKKILARCEKIFIERINGYEEFVLTENSEGIGMQCGGEAAVFFEFFPAHRKAYIFGAGHLARSLIPLLSSIDFYTIAVDNREEYMKKNVLTSANETIISEYEDYLHNFQPQKNDAIFIFTHGHKYDFQILQKICEMNLQVKYIGMIGSREKVGKTIEKIRDQKLNNELIEQVHSPIGLNIAKTTTQEISIAIAGEILAIYNNVSKIDFMKNLI